MLLTLLAWRHTRKCPFAFTPFSVIIYKFYCGEFVRSPRTLSLARSPHVVHARMECLYSFICLLWSFFGETFLERQMWVNIQMRLFFLLLPVFSCSPEWIYGHPESYGWRGCGSYFVNHHHHRLTRFFDVIVNELLKRRAAGARSFDSWLRRWHFVC